jgi:hypothetical protein
LIALSVSEPVFEKDSVLYVGENQRREMAGRMYQRSLHAEVHALLKSIKQCEKSYSFKRKNKPERPPMTLYVVRILEGNGTDCYTLGKSMPCVNCQMCLYYYNVTKIKYTDIVDGINCVCELRANKCHKIKAINYKMSERPRYSNSV